MPQPEPPTARVSAARGARAAHRPATGAGRATARRLVIVHVDGPAVVDLVVLERDVVFEDVVPALQSDLVGPRAGVRGDELLEVFDGVGGAGSAETTST